LSSRSKLPSSADKRLADYDAVFAALDNAARRQILMILHFRGDRMTAGEIADRFSCSWPTTSRHLRKLESAGLVEVERAGREWIYRLNARRLRVAIEHLTPPSLDPASAANSCREAHALLANTRAYAPGGNIAVALDAGRQKLDEALVLLRATATVN